MIYQQTPAHGDVRCTGTTYGETCHLTCHDGYERLSRDNFTCQVHGDKPTWSGEPECIPVSCGTPPEFPHTTIQRASGRTYGNTCGVTCADGYEGTNHQRVTCHSTGNWSLQAEALQPVVGGPDLFCQRKDCARLPPPAHGSLTCSGTRYQDSCRLTCEPGYKVAEESGLLLHSLYNFRCTANGQWNKKPSCVPSDYCQLGLHDCHPEHGVCSLTGHQAFSCRCRVGTVGNGTHCERTLCPPFPVTEPENGFFSCSIPTSSAADTCQSANSTQPEYEVVCVLHCNHGYDRLIYAEYSCRHDGNWDIPFNPKSPGTTACLAVKCPDLSSPLHGRMTCNSGYSFRYPEACSFACDRGYELTSTSSHERHCQTDATWSGNNTECIAVQCPTLYSPAHGRMSCNHGYSFRYPENCTFSCNHGYNLYAGSTSRNCPADRTWSGSSARCTRCPDGYVYYQPNQLCYKAFNQRGNYDEAAATCSSDGGTLAMPRDAGINRFLINLKNAVDNNALFWFGMTDRVREGSWVWADGVPLGHFKRWDPRQPDDAYGNEDCVHYFAGNSAIYVRNSWNDYPCSAAYLKFICQVAS
ncbi:P-selectin-like isoform X2 [Branchiostoma floridae]|uniref:P-selectin-like isoform X2 n=1 Tax=Branchiostoma floridae TaxID=7739 RepID=A0A9J7MWE6_BRAFL|nr:P-selectin-like isoform X2 [Branchiostoma floridae]